MASYNDLETHIKSSIEMESDKIIALMNPAINFGIWLATVLFQPVNQRQVENLTVVSTAGNITMNLTRLLRLDHLYNSTANKPMFPMSYDQLKMAFIAAGNAQFYTTYGARLYYRPTPSSNQTVNTHFLQYPTRINAGEQLPFGEYDDFVLSTAIQFMWATQEETENVDMWSKLTSMAGIGGNLITQVKSIMQREGMDVNNLSGTISKDPSET